jgi:hypothetical protein
LSHLSGLPGSISQCESSTSPALAGHAWLCLGKICLVDEGLAKKVVPLFVQVG